MIIVHVETPTLKIPDNTEKVNKLYEEQYMTREEKLKELEYRVPKKVEMFGNEDDYECSERFYCPTCGEELDECDWYDYCPYCGQKLDWVIFHD